MTIKNSKVKIETAENTIKITDLQRNTIWQLEDCSLQYGGSIVKNENIIPESDRLKNMTFICANIVNENSLQIFFDAGGAKISYMYTLLPDGFQVRLLLDNTQNIETISMPGSFAPTIGAKKLLLPLFQGMLWDGRGPDVSRFVHIGGHSEFSMQMYGVLAENGGLLCASEEESVDSRYRYMKDDGGFRVYNLAISSLGEMRYERTIRFFFTDPTITAVAKRYRSFVMDIGRFISWEEKIKQRPQLERLFGALMCFIGYSQDDIDYVHELEKLRDMGFSKALVYPVSFNTYSDDFKMGGLPPIKISDQDIEKIKSLGYDVSPWTWLTEAIESKSPANIFKVNNEGEKLFAWQIDDNKWQRVCTSVIAEQTEKASQGDFKAITWEHFDVVGCATIGECYDTTHEHHRGKAVSRREDLQFARQAMHYSKRDNTCIVSAEGFNDLFSLDYDIGSVKAWPLYGPCQFWPVPLTGLVYHDSILHSWWEVHNYNNNQFNRLFDNYEYGGGRVNLQSAMDALYGAPPDVFPFGAQYGWTGKGTETFTFRYRFEDDCVQYALKKALPITELHKKIGKLEMIDFEFLSDDGCVQRTTFADGTKVYANFSQAAVRNLPDVGTLMPHSWEAV